MFIIVCIKAIFFYNTAPDFHKQWRVTQMDTSFNRIGLGNLVVFFLSQQPLFKVFKVKVSGSVHISHIQICSLSDSFPHPLKMAVKHGIYLRLSPELRMARATGIQIWEASTTQPWKEAAQWKCRQGFKNGVALV